MGGGELAPLDGMSTASPHSSLSAPNTRLLHPFTRPPLPRATVMGASLLGLAFVSTAAAGGVWVELNGVPTR